MATPALPTPSTILATNVRRLREERGLRQADLAALMRAAGFRAWAEGTPPQVEAGTRRITVDELMALSLLLNAPLAELLRPADPQPALVRVGDLPVLAATLQVSAGQLPSTAPLSLTHGEAFRALEAEIRTALRAALGSFHADTAAAEESQLVADVATRLHVRPIDVIAAARRLWQGRGIREERERRLAGAGGVGDIRVRRGHVTRALMTELEQEFARFRASKRRSHR